MNWQANAANAAWRARALQKPKPASDLHGEGRQEQGEHSSPPRPDLRFSLRQSGTDENVPFRHSFHKDRPRLTAGFTAQLLGQILPDPERPASAAAMYGRQSLLLSLGFDTRL